MQETVSSEATDNRLQDGEQIASLMREEDRARSGTYAVLAAILSDIPTQESIDYLSGIETVGYDDDAHRGQVGEAWKNLKTASAEADLEKLDDEYHALFIGLGRGEIVPFASWHITGFLMDKPLSELRDDLRTLGFEADTERKEPEDHIAAICETMSVLIESDDVESFHQRRFYLRHLHSWAEKFFRELQAAKNADYYKHVGMLGERFIQLEDRYLNIQKQ